jgi:hypothetical protein
MIKGRLVMSALDSLEKSLEGVFKSAPKLPENGKKMIVEWLPWINLIVGAFTLLSVYWLYNWAHAVNSAVDYLNDISRIYGGTGISTSRWSVGLWIAVVVLAVEAVLYIMAFPATKARKKSGWDLLFYALLVNVAYGIVLLFTDYGGVGRFIGSIVGSVIGLYFLFQIRDMYLKKSSAPAAPKVDSSTPAA